MSVLAVVKNVFPLWGMNPPPGWKLDRAGKNYDENNNQISPHCHHPTGCQSKLFDVIYIYAVIPVNKWQILYFAATLICDFSVCGDLL